MVKRGSPDREVQAMSFIQRRRHDMSYAVPTKKTVDLLQPAIIWRLVFYSDASRRAKELLWPEVMTWAEDYARLKELEKEVIDLEREKSKIIALPLNREDTGRRYRELYEGYREERLKHLSYILENPREDFRGVRGGVKGVPLVPWVDPVEVDALVENLTDRKGSISLTEKNARVAQIEGEIDGVKAEIENLKPDIYFRDTRNRDDCRALFVDLWKKTQRFICKPANAFGIALDACPEGEQKAWKILGIDKSLDPEGLLPYQPQTGGKEKVR
jgi:hypothetical protein